RHGLPPAPERKTTTTWTEFIRAHMDVLVATDFSLQRHLGVLSKFAHVESRLCGRQRRGKAAFDVSINPCARRACSRSVAVGFFTAEVWTLGGLVTYYVLFFIHLGSRKVHIAGMTPHPNAAWMVQLVRNL